MLCLALGYCYFSSTEKIWFLHDTKHLPTVREQSCGVLWLFSVCDNMACGETKFSYSLRGVFVHPLPLVSGWVFRGMFALIQVPGGKNSNNYADVNLIVETAIKQVCMSYTLAWPENESREEYLFRWFFRLWTIFILVDFYLSFPFFWRCLPSIPPPPVSPSKDLISLVSPLWLSWLKIKYFGLPIVKLSHKISKTILRRKIVVP